MIMMTDEIIKVKDYHDLLIECYERSLVKHQDIDLVYKVSTWFNEEQIRRNISTFFTGQSLINLANSINDDDKLRFFILNLTDTFLLKVTKLSQYNGQEAESVYLSLINDISSSVDFSKNQKDKDFPYLLGEDVIDSFRTSKKTITGLLKMNTWLITYYLLFSNLDLVIQINKLNDSINNA